MKKESRPFPLKEEEGSLTAGAWYPGVLGSTEVLERTILMTGRYRVTSMLARSQKAGKNKSS